LMVCCSLPVIHSMLPILEHADTQDNHRRELNQSLALGQSHFFVIGSPRNQRIPWVLSSFPSSCVQVSNSKAPAAAECASPVCAYPPCVAIQCTVVWPCTAARQRCARGNSMLVCESCVRVSSLRSDTVYRCLTMYGSAAAVRAWQQHVSVRVLCARILPA